MCDRRESPFVGSRSPARRFMSVDFPAPFGPMIPTLVPMSIPRFKFSSANPSSFGYLKWQSVKDINGGGSSVGVGKWNSTS